jgi:hypothetical protein
MTSSNISIVMGSNLLRHPTSETQTLEDIDHLNKIVEVDFGIRRVAID